jgi:hypothetical protein
MAASGVDALRGEFPLRLHSEFLLRGFRGRNAMVAVYREALYRVWLNTICLLSGNLTSWCMTLSTGQHITSTFRNSKIHYHANGMSSLKLIWNQFNPVPTSTPTPLGSTSKKLKLYVCMNECMYMCVYVCMYICVCVFVCVCMYYVCVCERIYVCMHVCMCVCMYACMHACMYVFVFVCMYYVGIYQFPTNLACLLFETRKRF